MIDPIVGQVALGIYAALLAAGGLIGFLKAGSRPSLIAGLASGLVAVAALALSTRSPQGFWLGAALSAVMLVFFGRRFASGRKFMPGGMLTVASLAVLVVMILGIIRPSNG